MSDIADISKRQGAAQTNGHGNDVTPDNETRHARPPHPNPLPPVCRDGHGTGRQVGEGTNERLRVFHVKVGEARHGSHIRSFVLRQGRVTVAQQRAVEMLLPRFGISYRAAHLDLVKVFGRDAPRILEIGFGMGDSTATIALAHPENDYLALEVHTPGVGNLLKLIDAQQIANIRIIQHDAVEVLRDMIGMAELDGVHIFFPDPWHKTRHNKRRLIQAPFIACLVQRLKPGGYLHVATDWQDYAEQILAVLKAEALLENAAADYAPRPGYRPLTKFEQRGINLGHGVWDMVFRRKLIEIPE